MWVGFIIGAYIFGIVGYIVGRVAATEEIDDYIREDEEE